MSPRFCHAVRCAALGLLGALLLWPLSADAARPLARHAGLTAYVPDDLTCGEKAKVLLVGQSRRDFEGDRQPLQRLIGAVRLALDFECSQIRDIYLTGKVANATVWSGVVSAKDGWVVVELFTDRDNVANKNKPSRPRSPDRPLGLHKPPRKLSGSTPIEVEMKGRPRHPEP